MKWLALSVALLVPYVAGAFEAGDRVVCARSCEIKAGDKTIGTLLPGDAFAVAAEKAGLVQDSKRGGGWVRADCLIAEKDAVAHFRDQITTDPDDVESRCGLAMQLVKLDRDAALAEVEEAVRRHENRVTLGRKASIHSIRGEATRAMATLDRAVALEPDSVGLHEHRATLHLQAKDWRRAVADYTFVIDHWGTCSSALQGRGAAWIFLKKIENARADLQAALELDPENPDNVGLEVNLASLGTYVGKLDEAVLELEKVLERHPRCASAHKALAAIFQARGDLDSALTACTLSLEIDDKQADAFAFRAYLWQQKKQFDLCIDDWSKALKLAPNEVDYWGWRGFARAAQKENDLALVDFDEAIRLNPKFPNWYGYRGGIWEEQCEYQKALADLEKAIELGDSTSRVRQHLAWIYATCPDVELRNGEAAVRIAENLIKRGKGVSFATGETVAAAFAETGEFGKAAIVQRQVLSHAPEAGKQAALARLELYEAGKPYRSPAKQR